MSKHHKQAKELLQAANKVYHYRRDVTGDGRLDDLERAVEDVNTLVKDKKGDPATLEAANKRLDALLRKIGGKIYPKTFWSDNIEVALVAAIIVIGVRTFFFQPFIIPTNSMYPTYSGMNAVVYDADDPEPGAFPKFFRLLTLGARYKSVVAQNEGELLLPMERGSDGSNRIYFESVKGKKWFVLPTVLTEYTFLVNGVAHKLRVPAEFNPQFQSVLQDSFDFSKANWVRTPDSVTGYALDLGLRMEPGDPIIRFDITLGDALFVDRLSYHFIRPKAGDPFVFKTKDIPGIEGGPRNIVDKYYIKRIGGAGGESIEIREGVLYVDGAPRTEVEAYTRNANKEGEYNGYLNHEPFPHAKVSGFSGLGVGQVLDIPEDKYVALGDNSANSLDSRYWGYVPEKAVIGKAIFIYYPFTKRWGVAE